MPLEADAILARSVYTIQPGTIFRHFIQSQTRRVHAYLAVTCHLYFWQNDRDRLRATAITGGAKDTEIMSRYDLLFEF